MSSYIPRIAEIYTLSPAEQEAFAKAERCLNRNTRMSEANRQQALRHLYHAYAARHLRSACGLFAISDEDIDLHPAEVIRATITSTLPALQSYLL
jgi:hypothetical protein